MLDTLYLHKSLDSPALQAGSFLNEVIEKYSDSISFAPGAPNPKQFDNLKIEYYIQLYINYIQNKYDLSKEDAKRTIYQYGPSQGIINKIIAEAIFNDNKITFPEESVLITTGAQEAMFIILRAILNSNQMQLAVVNPCYIGILGAAKLLDISITSINESSSGINLQELDHKCYQAKKLNHPIKLLYLSPDGSNPSGSLLDLESRLEVLNLANKHDFYIIEDSTYSFTIPSENKLPSLKQLDNYSRVLYILSFAKICFPGARVAYIIADKILRDDYGNQIYLAEKLAMIKSMITINTPPICQAIIAGMLLESDCSIYKLEKKSEFFYQRNMQVLLRELNNKIPESEKISWNKPLGGFFVCMKLPVNINMNLLEVSAKEFGVIWTPMSSFYLDNQGQNEIRLSCSYLEEEEIIEGVARLAMFIDYLLSIST